MSLKKSGTKKVFDKYAYYHESVQSADTDVRFLRGVYRELRGAEPRVLREDFCGTFQLCVEWARLHSENRAVGLDLDPEPLEYGQRLLETKSGQIQKQVQAFKKNVLDPDGPHADITVAMNFSYFIFQTRAQMREYFVASLRALKTNGIFVLDIFGGTACQEANEEKTRLPGFTYYWHQRSFDPVSHHADFSIHFKPHGGRKILDVFTYDWRMWTIPELRELLVEAGFKNTHVYWEGTNRKGGGSGNFKRREKGEECIAWIAYIVAEK